MSGGKKSLVAVWRDALRDSGLRSIVKLVGYTLSTYMNSRGLAFPSRETLARGASLGLRSVDAAISDLECGGFVAIERTRGRSSHRYQATLPPTAQEMRRSEWATAHMTTPNRAYDDTNRASPAGESVESAESGALGAAPAFGGGAAGALVEDECMRCFERRTLYEWRDRLVCLDCIHDATGELEDRLRAHVKTLREATA